MKKMLMSIDVFNSVAIALVIAISWSGCAKTIEDKKVENPSAPGTAVSSASGAPDETEVQPGEHVEEALEEGWKRVEVKRLSFAMPDSWRHSSNPMAPSYSNQLKVFSPDNSCTVMITLTRWRDDMTLTEAVQMTNRGMSVRMMGVPDFRGATVKGGGAEEDELWGRSGVLTYFDLVEAPQDTGGEEKALLRAKIYGELVEATSEVLFINVLLKGEDKGEAEKIVRSLRILP